MPNYINEFTSYMDENGVKYTEQNEHTVKVSYVGDNLSAIPVFIFFDKDNDPLVQFKCWEIMNFKTNEEAGIQVCNSLNAEYRWVKFYVDSDKDVVASLDAMISSGTCGAECLSLVKRIVSIIDDAYPKIAKARWA